MNASILKTAEPVTRMRLELQGAVQGVGFRPFVYRLAEELRLTGWVRNSSKGVVIEVEGPGSDLELFVKRLDIDKPSPAQIIDIQKVPMAPTNDIRFEIQESNSDAEATAWILPDLATCDECLSEIQDSGNRRYRYPFTNCTRCGPRYSIMNTLPYDRPGTSMSGFAMCGACRVEYENPADRRFHAQPNACPECGPHVELWTPQGHCMASRAEALAAAVDLLRNQKILAVKGLGGFHLMVDARSSNGIRRLREIKRRSEKPFAVMFPSLTDVRAVCETLSLEEELLCSPQAPIVLLNKKPVTGEILLEHLAPRNSCLGVMLPYTPLHHLLMQELGFPVIATSGNISEETLCTDNSEALKRLGSGVDGFLMHNRDIVNAVDDSVVGVILERETIFRRARGYSPLPLPLPPRGNLSTEGSPVILAVGGHLKNTIAVARGAQAVMSPHIGDLGSEQTLSTFKRTMEQWRHLYPQPFSHIACDSHPDYASSRFAAGIDLPRLSIQHHYAHVLSCMVDNRLEPPVLGVAWDGTGYGPDGTVWGGEFLKVGATGFRRTGYLRPFSLPGSHQAVREPRRSALGLLYELSGEAAFDERDCASVQEWTAQESGILKQMLKGDLQCPRTSSAGRLFDAVASLLNVRQTVSYEGQAAMELEHLARSAASSEGSGIRYPFVLKPVHSSWMLDWEPMIRGLLEDARRAVPASFLSLKFHNTLAEMIVALVQRAKEKRIVLTGGCFQNIYLTERVVIRLREEGFEPYWHHRVPPNDGGISAGQALAAIREIEKEER